jgi:hypothetical protein
MSFARFGPQCDVYVFAHVGGFVQCCGCQLGDKWDFHSPEAIVEHLKEHVEAGHLVPEKILDPSTYEPEDFTPYESDTEARA